MTNAVIFGAGVTVLNVSALRDNAQIWISVAVVASLILAAPFAWLIAHLVYKHATIGGTLRSCRNGGVRSVQLREASSGS
jgi:hypothetical protein